MSSTRTHLALLISTFALLVGCQNHSSLDSMRLMCEQVSQWRGQIIGDGQCVTLIKLCSNAPNTSQWRPGPLVQNATIQPGTVIATFKNNRYPSKTGYHAAVNIKQTIEGVWVWDQWQGTPVHQRKIRWHNPDGTAANTRAAYRIVEVLP